MFLTVCEKVWFNLPALEVGNRRFKSCHTDHICRCSPLGGHWIVYPIKAGSIPVDGAKFIVSSRSNSFDRLRQKQGSEMQEYIIGVSPVGKRNLFREIQAWCKDLTVNQ